MKKVLAYLENIPPLIAIIRFTESTGRTYIVDVTTDPEAWLVENNSTREEQEKLSDFEIEWTTLKTY